MIFLSLLQRLMEWDRDLLIWLNSIHADSLDPVMYNLTQTWFWIPLYVFLLWLIIKDFKKEWWIPMVGIGLTILLADQVTSSLMKPYFARLRPSQEPSLQGIIHLVMHHGQIYTGGLYGFASSHAANTFATATFFSLLFKPKHNWMLLLFPWAIIMTYTRIYLGVHYPGDILFGATVGVLSALVGYWAFKKLKAKVDESSRAA